MTETSGLPPEVENRLMACVDLVHRTGASGFQLRYSDDEQPVVWMAIAGYANGRRVEPQYEVGAALAPDRAAFRLVESLVDGGQCQHCKRPTGVDDSWGKMPFDEHVCWYQYDPEIRKFRRGCEGDVA